MKVTLRQKLMQLSLTLTAIGVVLLLVSLITTLWLRTYSDHLAQQRAPAVVATQRAQIGLQHSLAGLRGWVALEDPRFRSERRVAWSQRIEPALGRHPAAPRHLAGSGGPRAARRAVPRTGRAQGVPVVGGGRRSDRGQPTGVARGAPAPGTDCPRAAAGDRWAARGLGFHARPARRGRELPRRAVDRPARACAVRGRRRTAVGPRFFRGLERRRAVTGRRDATSRCASPAPSATGSPI